MKNLSQYMIEKLIINKNTKIKEPDGVKTTIGRFYMWYTGSMNRATEKSCSVLIDNGWFDNFEDSPQGKRKCAEFIEKNFKETIYVVSTKVDTGQYELEFEFNGETYIVDSIEEYKIRDLE